MVAMGERAGLGGDVTSSTTSLRRLSHLGDVSAKMSSALLNILSRSPGKNTRAKNIDLGIPSQTVGMDHRAQGEY